MLSRLCCGSLCRSQVLNTANVRQLTLTAVRGARTGGLGRTISEQFSFKTRTAAGPTLRERLLGPTSGKPFLYGTYAIAGASVCGVGMLCYYGLGMSKEVSAVDRSTVWPAYVRQRLQHTYSYLAAALGLTAAAGLAGARSPLIMSIASRGGFMAMFAWIAAIVGTSALTQGIPYESTLAKHVAWALHCGVMGAMLAPLCLIGGPVVIRAAWYTAAITAGLSATAICAPSEKFLAMAGPLGMGFCLVFAANIGSLFLPAGSALGAGLMSFAVYGGLILFSAFILYDTQRIIRRAETTPDGRFQTYYDQNGQLQYTKTAGGFDPINAQISLYADILNIFIRLVFILSGGGNRRK